MRRIDLNCDMGESFDPESWAVQERVIPYVTSVSIACGGHAGNPDLMRRTIRLAKAHGVNIGAHPGFLDPEGFGRRETKMTPYEVETLVAYQVGALGGIAAIEGIRLSHVKPHGALYNQAARDRALADAVIRAVAAVDSRMILVGLAGSQLIEAARARGIRAAEEAFADRAYQADGTLVPRGQPGAVIHDAQEVAERAVHLVCKGVVRSRDGAEISVKADTLCVHGDTPGADRLVGLIRQKLEEAGIRITAVDDA